MDHKTFNTEIGSTILAVAKLVLSGQEISEANRLSDSLLKDEAHRAKAIEQLRELIGTRPKRPVYYLNDEIKGLPGHTRDVVRYAGDYIDQLIKYCSYEKGGHRAFRSRALSTSLGGNLTRLKGVLPAPLFQALSKFNEVVYVPAKHEWNVRGRPHLFSAKEAVFICFMMKELAAQIVRLSAEAQAYSESERHGYHYDARA